MYICVCHAVTDSDIRTAVESGVRNMRQLNMATGCGSSCGCCKDMADTVLEQALTKNMEAPCLFPVLQMA